MDINDQRDYEEELANWRELHDESELDAPEANTTTRTEAAIKLACLIVTLYIVVNILTGWGWRP